MKVLSLTIGAALTFGGAASAMAEKPRDGETPAGWSYEVKGGERVPKAKRQVNPDGSWREEIRQGSCVTIREKTSKGEYRETREC